MAFIRRLPLTAASPFRHTSKSCDFCKDSGDEKGAENGVPATSLESNQINALILATCLCGASLQPVGQLNSSSIIHVTASRSRALILLLYAATLGNSFTQHAHQQSHVRRAACGCSITTSSTAISSLSRQVAQTWTWLPCSGSYSRLLAIFLADSQSTLDR